MTEEKTKWLVDGLRGAADWFEQHPEYAPTYSDHVFNEFVNGKEDLVAALPAFGKAEKVPDGLYFSLRKRFSRNVMFDLNAPREQVCSAVVVGKETVTEKVATGYEEQTVERDIIEWRCDPLLVKVPDAA